MLVSSNSFYNRGNHHFYFGYLVIPKIGLKQGFYKIGDENNILNNGIKLIKYTMDVIVMVGLSTNKDNSFKDLIKLKIDDEIRIIQNNEMKKYLIKDIYLEKRSGALNIVKRKDDKILILTTKSLLKKENQLIIKANLV